MWESHDQIRRTSNKNEKQSTKKEGACDTKSENGDHSNENMAEQAMKELNIKFREFHTAVVVNKTEELEEYVMENACFETSIFDPMAATVASTPATETMTVISAAVTTASASVEALSATVPAAAAAARSATIRDIPSARETAMVE